MDTIEREGGTLETINPEIARIEQLIKVYVEGSTNPDVRAYWGSGRDARYMLRKTLKAISMANMRQVRVLDIGCGFGWDAALLSFVGGNEVVANDIRPTMTEVVEERIESACRAGISGLSVSTLLGDVCEIELEENSFDAVHSSEAIEHVHDLEKMFSVVRRVLRPGGRGVFFNTSNALHPPTRMETEKMWLERDASHELVETLKAERPIENASIEPYAVMRQRLISEKNPGLSPESIDVLVSATAGLNKKQIEQLADSYVPGNSLPTRPALSWCRNPITGEYCERLLDPFEVAGFARKQGLKARVWHHRFNRMPLTLLNVINGLPLEWVNRLVFRLRPQFAVTVRKAD